MNTSESAFRQIDTVITKILATQNGLGSSAARLLLWRTVEGQLQTCITGSKAPEALIDLEQLVAEHTCTMADDAVWLEVGSPARTLLVFDDGSAYLHEDTSAMLRDILGAGSGPNGQWQTIDAITSEDQVEGLTGAIRWIVVGLPTDQES